MSKNQILKMSISAVMVLSVLVITGCDNTNNSTDENNERTNNTVSTEDIEKSADDINKSTDDITKEVKIPDSINHEYQITLKGLNELSGICLSLDGNLLYGVDDEGKLYEIELGKIISSIDNKSLVLENYKRKKTDIHYDSCNIDSMFTKTKIRHDGMEGIAIDSAGNLYIGLEEEDKCVYKIDYLGNGYDFDNCKPTEMVPFTYDCGDNEGVEGIAWYKHDDEEGLYLGTQTGVNLFYYSFKDEPLNISTPLRSLRDAEGMDEEKKENGKKIDEIAGLDYDVENDRLWVIDSNNFRIYLFNGEGTKLLKSYDISDIIEDPENKSHNNPEGLCIDKKRGCIWVCEDINGNSILHKYNFENL